MNFRAVFYGPGGSMALAISSWSSLNSTAIVPQLDCCGRILWNLLCHMCGIFLDRYMDSFWSGLFLFCALAVTCFCRRKLDVLLEYTSERNCFHFFGLISVCCLGHEPMSFCPWIERFFLYISKFSIKKCNAFMHLESLTNRQFFRILTKLTNLRQNVCCLGVYPNFSETSRKTSIVCLWCINISLGFFMVWNEAAYNFTRIPRLLGGTLARHFARSLVWGQSWSSRAAEFFWIQSYVQRCAVVNRIFLNIRCLFKGDLIRFVVPSCQEESVQGNGTRVSHFSTFRYFLGPGGGNLCWQCPNRVKIWDLHFGVCCCAFCFLSSRLSLSGQKHFATFVPDCTIPVGLLCSHHMWTTHHRAFW